MQRIIVTASTFPTRHGDSGARFILDLCIAIQKQNIAECIVLTPHAAGSKFSETNGMFLRIKNKPILALLIPFLCLSQLAFLLWDFLRYRPKAIILPSLSFHQSTH